MIVTSQRDWPPTWRISKEVETGHRSLKLIEWLLGDLFWFFLFKWNFSVSPFWRVEHSLALRQRRLIETITTGKKRQNPKPETQKGSTVVEPLMASVIHFNGVHLLDVKSIWNIPNSKSEIWTLLRTLPATFWCTCYSISDLLSLSFTYLKFAKTLKSTKTLSN